MWYIRVISDMKTTGVNSNINIKESGVQADLIEIMRFLVIYKKPQIATE